MVTSSTLFILFLFAIDVVDVDEIIGKSGFATVSKISNSITATTLETKTVPLQIKTVPTVDIVAPKATIAPLASVVFSPESVPPTIIVPEAGQLKVAEKVR